MEQFIKNLARGAGAILHEGFRSEIEINHKEGHWDIVTQYDLASDKFIQDRIKKKFPTHGILSEEGSDLKNKNSFWIIDPLDGTRNFSRGISLFSVLIAYVDRGILEYGVVYNPIHNELFFAKRGKGATMNGKKINVSGVSSLDHAFGMFDGPENYSEVLERRIDKLVKKESIWSNKYSAVGIDLAYLAAGRHDFGIFYGVYPWDYAPGALICQEAGAKVTDSQAKPYRWNSKSVVVANPKLHTKIFKYLK